MFCKIGLSLLLIISSVAAANESKKCDKVDARDAEEIADGIKDWQIFLLIFQRFEKCDDGAIAEGFSDSVGQLLTTKWNTLPKLDRMIGQDKTLKQFVLKHLDITISLDDQKTIISNAKDKCPTNLKELCQDIIKRFDQIK